MHKDQLEGIKRQMQNVITSYPQPGVVSPNLLHPQLVLDLVAEVERLSKLEYDKTQTIWDVTDDAITADQMVLSYMQQAADAQVGYAKEIEALRVDYERQLAELRAENARLKKSVSAPKKTAAKKKG